RPALAHVGAAGAGADGVEVVALDGLLHTPERLAVGELHAEPVGPRARPVGLARLLYDGELEHPVVESGAIAGGGGGAGGLEGDLAGAAGSVLGHEGEGGATGAKVRTPRVRGARQDAPTSPRLPLRRVSTGYLARP